MSIVPSLVPYELQIPGQVSQRRYGVLMAMETETILAGMVFQSYDMAEAFLEWGKQLPEDKGFWRAVAASDPRFLEDLKAEFENPKVCECGTCQHTQSEGSIVKLKRYRLNMEYDCLSAVVAWCEACVKELRYGTFSAGRPFELEDLDQ